MNKYTVDYTNKISRQDALKLANGYLQERIHNGSKINIIFEHGVHIFNVAKIAESIAAQTKGHLDADTAYCLGLLHDIGRIKDETITHVPHGVEGFNYLNKIGYPDIAPICLTHNFIDKNIQAEDFPTYSPHIFAQTKEFLNNIEYNDYDRIIQVADLFSRGKEIMSIQQRLDKNKSFYHIPKLSYEDKAFQLRDYLDNKYNIDIEQTVADLFNLHKHSNSSSVIFFLPKKIPLSALRRQKPFYLEK